ncbi:cysteine dioxygenase [Winogradskyella aurantiaca]|uniref:cysteine dioxygenase n=1 Tax=Winogradskyella aurantiaca TaxID=2219558 RepID=UPI000E1CA110|nr:cysteine dioxygenase family protein [Winogradskyella aurantiaca]
MNSNPDSLETLLTLDDLITALLEEDKTTYNYLIKSISLEAKDFDAYTSWSKDCYTRNCVVNNEKFELVLICWGPGQMTPIHDHGGEECWVKVIEGELEEVIYKKNKNNDLVAVRSSISKPNQVTYMKDFMGFHSLQNVSESRSLTLHLYAKPISSCNILDEDSNTFVRTELFYHTTA